MTSSSDARVDLLRGQITYVYSPGSDAPAAACSKQRGASRPSISPLLERPTSMTFTAAVIVGRLSRGADVAEVAKPAAPASPLPNHRGRAPDLLLDGLALLIAEGRAAGTPLLKQAISAFRNREIIRRRRAAVALARRTSTPRTFGTTTAGTTCAPGMSNWRGKMGALAVLPIALQVPDFRSLAGRRARRGKRHSPRR